MDLSRFFSLTELTRSDTAARENISNEPDPRSLEHLRALCTTILDPLRHAIGRPIRVNSGYRGPALNARIGGAKKSQHLEGKAADIQSPGMSVLDLFKTLIRLNLPFDQLIYEAQSRTVKWVHVSHDPERSRRQIMVAKFGPNGRAIAYPAISAEDALALSEPALRSRMPKLWAYREMPDEPAARLAPAEAAKRRAIRKRAYEKSTAKPKRTHASAQKVLSAPKSRKTRRVLERGTARGRTQPA